MRSSLRLFLAAAIALFPVNTLRADDRQIPNPLIDTPGFLRDVQQAQIIREEHRMTEAEFVQMAKEPGTVVLDARSAERYAQMHVTGSQHLAFTDFTEASLAAILPGKDTRILIYCNNNILNSPTAFPPKLKSAALNLSTFTSLYSYGYRNVYELGPAIDPAKSQIQFEGSLAPKRAN